MQRPNPTKQFTPKPPLQHPSVAPWTWGFVLCLMGFNVACTTTRRQIKREHVTHPMPSPERERPQQKRGAAPKKIAAARKAPSPSQPKTRPAPMTPPSFKGGPFSHVVLLNGGLNKYANFYSHFQHLTMMRKVMKQRGVPEKDITIFSSDGENNNPDLVVQNPPTFLEQMLFEKRRRESFLVWPQLRSINTIMPGKRLLPSQLHVLYKFFQDLPSKLHRHPDKKRPVLIFVTDHGQRNRSNDRNNKISLWRESMDVRQYHRMLQALGRRRVISVMSQCFSGGFAWSNYRQPGVLDVPSGDRCGFYSTTAKRPAFGCYPDTSKQSFVGYGYRFAKALSRASTLEEAHRLVNLTDKTPDIPLRSSDSYLYNLLQVEAQRQGQSLGQFADQLLSRHRRSGYPGYQKDNELLKAIAKRFNLQKPLYTRQTSRWSRDLKQAISGRYRLQNNWARVYRTIRDANLGQWYKRNRPIAQRLSELYGLYLRNTSMRHAMSRDRYIQKLRYGFATYIKRKPKILRRIKHLYKKMKLAHNHVFWAKVLLAVYQRMERQLIRIAGRLLLRHENYNYLQPHRQGLQNLLVCEATPLDPSRRSMNLASIRPIKRPPAPFHSWLGVGFRPLRSRFDSKLTAGAVQVTEIYLNTPAAQGGLRPGDFILATNGRKLQHQYDLPERVMLHPTHKPFVLQLLRNNHLIERTVKLQRTYGNPSMKLQPIIGKTISTWRPLKTLSRQDSLPQLNRSTTLVLFWATWCGPCKAALPWLRRIKKKYSHQGLRIVTVSQEKPRVILNWLQNNPHKMPFTNTQDAQGSFSIQMRITATPTFVVIRNGKIETIRKGFQRMRPIERAIRLSLRKN